MILVGLSRIGFWVLKILPNFQCGPHLANLVEAHPLPTDTYGGIVAGFQIRAVQKKQNIIKLGGVFTLGMIS